MTMRGRTQTLRLCAFLMKYVSIFSVTSKSAITPSFIGLMATMLPGVRPSMSFASLPTASTRPFTLLMATMDGSLTTIPLPRAYTHVLAVPKSIARSLENNDSIERRLNGTLLTNVGSAPHPGSVACGGPYAPRRSLAGAPCAPKPRRRRCDRIVGRTEPASGLPKPRYVVAPGASHGGEGRPL